MNERERFIETLLFGKPDKIPLMPGLPRESTLERWHKEGLPPGNNWYGSLLKKIGVTGDPDPTNSNLDISFKMIPEFEEKVLEPILSAAPPDHILISEDMAHKGKSMISPGMVRRFLLPCWQAWLERIKKSGCRLIEVDSDGYIGELIPLWIETGINVCSPIEVAAGDDLPALRRKFGRNMAYRGGIDKRAIAKGGKIIEQELLRVVPPLLKEGGYIPSCDHGVPPDISWQNFVEYSRLLAKSCGWL